MKSFKFINILKKSSLKKDNKNEYITKEEWSGTEFFDKGCPYCGNDDVWYEGPCGGLSVNFMCGICEAKFNNVAGFRIELISYPTVMPYSLNIIHKED